MSCKVRDYKYKSINHDVIPDAPCMVYLPTFGVY